MRFLATVLAATIAAGGIAAGRGSALSFGALWASLGATVAPTTFGIFSVGFVVAPAVLLLIAAITVAPDPSASGARLGWHTALAFAAGYGAPFWPLLVL